MESSVSTPYHRRRLSSVNGFSSKNAYDDVFSSPATLGARKVKSRVLEDYKEIFASSCSSSIPVLDISPPGGVEVDSVSDYRNSELDYSNIFGGLREDDAGVWYEQVVANAAGTNRDTTTPRKVRTPSAAESPLHSSECLKTSSENKVSSSDSPFQSVDDKKQFNMSYHKSNTGSKDGTNGTTHVAQFHPVRGFTCFIDETTLQKIEADKPKSSVSSDVHRKVDVDEAVQENRNTKKGMSNHTNKETFGRHFKSRSNFSWDGSYNYDKLSDSHENNVRSHPTEKRPPSKIPAKIDSSGNLKRLWASKNDASEHVAGESSPSILSEELDVNSTAAASAAVLKDAIQKAQESIRLAKELMERKKEGLRSHSSHNFRNNMKVKDKKENVIAYEGNRLEDTNAKDISGSADYVSQLFSGMRKKSALKSGLSPDFKQKGRSVIKEKVIDDEHAKSLGMAEESELPSIEKKKEVMPSLGSMDKVESNVIEHQQVHKEKTDEKDQGLDYVERKLNTVKGDNRTEVEPVCIVSDQKTVENCKILRENEFMEEIHTHIHINKDGKKRSKDSQQKIKDAMEFESNNDLRVNNLAEPEDIQKDGSDNKVENNSDDVVDEERYSINIHDEKGSEQISESFENKEDPRGRFEKAEFTKEIEVLQEAHHESDVGSHVVHDKNETQKASQYKINHVHLETGQEVDDHSVATKDFYDFKVNESEAVELASKLREKENLSTGHLAQDLAEEIETGNSMNVVSEISPSKESSAKFGSTCTSYGEAEFAQSSVDIGSDSSQDCGIESMRKGHVLKDRLPFNEEAGKSRLGYVSDDRRHDGHFEISQGPKASKANEKTVEVDIEIKIRKDTTKNVEGVHKIIITEEKKIEMDEEIQAREGKKIYDESSGKVFDLDKEAKKIVSVVKEKEGLIKNNDEMKRDQEREKEKIAVERAIREVRERAFAEARERAERAAVERATAEVRQRVMAEAREKFNKDTAATKLSAEKASVQAKLRSERAAVERATAEARERALEKALSQKSRAQTGKSASQNHTGPSRDDSMKKSSSSDLETNCENNTDLIQRNKANVEKHERIMERTAKALAEKNMRDLLAQKELAEKNRLAEALDADIKRWSSGKEGNLRALLSTLQYILGPSSGWQPISLTEILTTSAVKKAYRKATLYVHPDKVQQRGASIQQKYICEKVFDLLKAAWNKFNKEER